jgi:hypothetical protein
MLPCCAAGHPEESVGCPGDWTGNNDCCGICAVHRNDHAPADLIAESGPDSCYVCGAVEDLTTIEAELNTDYPDGHLTLVSICGSCRRRR